MLLLGSRLLNAPVMSLQTGTQLAQITRPLIDPANLKIVAYEIEGPLLADHPSFILSADIREYGRLGMIIDSNDEIIGLEDVIAVQKLYNLSFPLVGMSVIDEFKRKLGKVDDYTLETNSFVIQQLNVRRGWLKGINDTGVLINRAQIIEINDSEIIVKSTAKKSTQPVMESIRSEFVNPFRNPSPHPEPESITTS